MSSLIQTKARQAANATPTAKDSGAEVAQQEVDSFDDNENKSMEVIAEDVTASEIIHLIIIFPAMTIFWETFEKNRILNQNLYHQFS